MFLGQILFYQNTIHFLLTMATKEFFTDDGVKEYEKYTFSGQGSYLPSNRNSPKSDLIENAPLAILISTEQF